MKTGTLNTKRGKKSANGVIRILQLLDGKKEVARIEYWPWQSASVDNAYDYIAQAAKNNNLEVDWDTDNQ